jgi:short chain dehydrogenase/RibD C-terminal domain
MTGAGQRVAIITGGSQGIGAGLVAAYRRRDWAVVANSRTIKPSEDEAAVTISGDISEPATTDRIIGEALDRFGRIDTLINNAGIFIAKPFTDYTADDYASVVAVNLTGFFTLTGLSGCSRPPGPSLWCPTVGHSVSPGELQVHGSGSLVRWLFDNQLVDEIILLTVPVVVGQSTRLFPDTGPDTALDLVDSRATPKGVTIQVYRPTGRPQYATATTDLKHVT